MLKTTYEKWEDVTKNASKNNEYISEYLISKNNICRFYFSIHNEMKSIYIEFSKHILDDIKMISLNGIDITVVDNESINRNKKFLKITCKEENYEIFYAFVSSLVDGVSECKTELYVIDFINDTIKKFKKFFANSCKSLSEFEEQGLFAELYELKQLISNDGSKVIMSWYGPEKNKRDFVFEEKSVEIKSTISQINPVITISNELQLDNKYPKDINLFLKVYILEKRDEGLNVVSISNDIVNMIDNDEMKKVFLSKLLKAGVFLEKYNYKNCYSIEDVKYYKVTDEFPKITKSNINNSIFDVEYKISLNSLKGLESNE